MNAGAGFGNVKTDLSVTPIGTTAVPGVPALQNSPGFAFSNRKYPDGFIGGGQIGYNWQYSPLIVVGLEADFQSAHEKDSNSFVNSFSGFSRLGGIIANTAGTASTNYSTQMDWFGTVRARIGYVWGNGEVMSYIVGGLAYGEVKVNGTNTVSAFAEVKGKLPAESVSQTFGRSQVNTGWVVGYGMEGHLPLMPGNWTWKIEGLYMDLGTVDANGVTSSVFLALKGATATGGQVTTHSHFTDGILRGGLNYRF